MSQGDGSILNFRDIEIVDDSVTETIEIPQWGGAIRIRTLKMLDRDEITELSRRADGKFNDHRFNMLLLQRSIVDPKMTEQQADILSQKSVMVINMILQRILKLNQMATNQTEVASKIEVTFPETTGTPV